MAMTTKRDNAEDADEDDYYEDGDLHRDHKIVCIPGSHNRRIEPLAKPNRVEP